MIVKRKGGYEVISKKKNKKGKHKNLGGPYKSKKKAAARLRAVEYFKYHKSHAEQLIAKAIRRVLELE